MENNALLETAARVALVTDPKVLPIAKYIAAIPAMEHAERSVTTVSCNTTEVRAHVHISEVSKTTSHAEEPHQLVVGETRAQTIGLTAHNHQLTQNGQTLVGR